MLIDARGRSHRHLYHTGSKHGTPDGVRNALVVREL
jgi:hypothetical protein